MVLVFSRWTSFVIEPAYSTCKKRQQTYLPNTTLLPYYPTTLPCYLPYYPYFAILLYFTLRYFTTLLCYPTNATLTLVDFFACSIYFSSVQLHLLDHGEEYTMTLPNTYIRSLLTYPWMELGGRSTISCSQSGYSAVVDFHSKVGPYTCDV